MSTQYNPEYYQKNKDALIGAIVKHRKANIGKYNAYQRKYRQRNKFKFSKAQIKPLDSETLVISKNVERMGIVLKAGTYKLVKDEQ